MRTWNLLNDMEKMHREFDQLFNGFGFGRMTDPAFMPGVGVMRFPKLALREDTEHYFIDAILPGVDPKTLEMTVTGTTLTIAGERVDPHEKEKGLTWHRRERGFGKFTRTIELPNGVNSATAKADYKDGVLCVTLPKAEEAKPKRIAIAAH